MQKHQGRRKPELSEDMNKKGQFGVFKSDLGNSLTPVAATENCAFNFLLVAGGAGISGNCIKNCR